MAPKGLLRYLFRRRTHGKPHDDDGAPPTVSTKRHVHRRHDAASPPLGRKNVVWETCTRTASTVPKSPEPIFTTLEDIAEETIAGDGNSDGSANVNANANTNTNTNTNPNGEVEGEGGDISSLSTSTTSFTPSLTDTLAALNLDIDTFNTRELVMAILNEAQAAVKSHLDTLDDTLVLLSALAGSSGVVDMWEKEMRKRKRVCKEKKAILNEAERAIREMIFVEEVGGREGEV